MGPCCSVIGFTLLLITVSFTSFPSETAATETKTYDSVRKIFGFVKQKSPELAAAAGVVFESSVYYGSVAVKWVGAAAMVGGESSVYYGWPAVKWVGAAGWGVCESCYCYGSSAVKRVGDAIWESVNSYLHNGTATRDIGSGIYNSVKQNLPDLSSVKDVYKNSYSYGSSAVSNVDAAIREGANRYLQDEKARSDLASFFETMVFTIMQELAKGVPGGVPAYNIISKTFHGGGDKNSQDNQDQSEVTKLISEVAKTVGLYAIEKGAQNVPGGAPAYKLISQYLQPMHEDEDRRRELKELHARIDKLEREGCGCKKLHNKNETLGRD